VPGLTHLAISFCRALNIPARYVFGYLPDMDLADPAPMDFAAWMESGWASGGGPFDPRNNTTRKGRVVIGRGPRRVDVAMATRSVPLLETDDCDRGEKPPEPVRTELPSRSGLNLSAR